MESATSAGDLATAMSYTATSAKDAGVGIDQLTGMIASVAEVSQAGAEQVGTFFKTMFARMSAVKAGDLIDPESEEDISNVETVLDGLGVKLRDTNKEFRNSGDVLLEVSNNWKNYSSVQQAAIASAFAGTRQIDKFRILMSTMGTATKYATDAANSNGVALSKYSSSYLQGIESSQDKAKASFEALSTTIVNSEIVKGAFGVGSGILGFLNKLLSAGDGAVPKIALLVAGLALLNKSIKAISTANLANVGRAKMIALINMPTNDLMVTWNELIA